MTEPTPTDPQAQNLVRTLAAADPDFEPFAQTHAFLSGPALTDAAQAALGRDLLAVLRESAEQAPRIDALSRSPAPGRFDSGLASVSILVAATFLLRTHIRFKRRPDGTWEFLIEHKPADSKRLTELLKKLAPLLPGGDASGPGSE